MKRIIALIMALMMAACLFAACGDDDTYRQPGTGTTLGGGITTPARSDDNGTYSADPDGEVNPTTDDNILEDGIDDIEDGLNEGLNDLEQGINDLENGAEDMLGGDMNDNNDMNNGMNGQTGANGVNGSDGMNGENGTETSGMENRNDNGMNNGSTNGNSH